MFLVKSPYVGLAPSLVSRLPGCLELLPQITISLGHHLEDAHAFFSDLLNHVIQSLKASSGCLFLSGDHGRWRYCLGRDPVGGELAEQRFQTPAAQECVSRARGSQQSVTLRDWLGSPLLVHGECVGVLCLQRSHQHSDFTSGEGQLVDCVARQACVALVQARLRQQLEHTEQALQQERNHRLNLQQQNEGLQLHALLTCHELQAPLRGLTGLAEVALRSAPQSDELELSMQGIGLAAQRLSELQDSLLQYCKATSLPLTLQRISSSSVLTSVCQELHQLLHLTQADFQRDNLPWCEADPTALRCILRSLLHNALTFRRGKPRLQVGFRNGIFRVRDEGPGIPPDQFQRVFEPFVRLHAREDYPGSGLGLTVCRLLVERQGGRIWIEGNPEGPGLTVCFTLGATS